MADALWRTETADRFGVIIDGAAYFQHARQAMLAAEHRIALIGWDFDVDLVLDPEADEGPADIGDFLVWLVRRRSALRIYILRWDLGLLKMLLRSNALRTLMRWWLEPRIHARLDGLHPPAGTHHQKIVVIDDAFAFCGGIDMLADRWDTPEHRDDDPGRRDRRGRIAKPWHDVTTAMSGPAAAALGELFRRRWRAVTGRTLAPARSGAEAGADPWPEGLAELLRDVPVGIARSVPAMKASEPVREVEALFLDHIAAAKRFIYAESQYFASRRIAEAIALRLEEADGPEVVLINPETAEGWLEPIAMDSARARLYARLKARDRHDRLRLYHPFTAGGEAIYVHAKVMIVDDVTLRIGSANLNNRSMRLDTECDVVVTTSGSRSEAVEIAIRGVRIRLLAELLGLPETAVARQDDGQGSLIAAIEALRADGGRLRPYSPPDLSNVETWLADNEVLDPEGAEEMFEPTARRGLFRRRRPWIARRPGATPAAG